LRIFGIKNFRRQETPILEEKFMCVFYYELVPSAKLIIQQFFSFLFMPSDLFGMRLVNINFEKTFATFVSAVGG
jgi:hypothetical protein